MVDMEAESLRRRGSEGWMRSDEEFLLDMPGCSAVFFDTQHLVY